jgi:alkanesulfonate monooxygenase SsuD/methylene tetrahydromethanopterin reductase-like flavin-dependent oxidoreductase (luciferase family)
LPRLRRKWPADGWLPVEASVEQLRSTTSLLGTLAKAAGRDPKDIKIIARYNFTVTPQPLGEGRQFFSGTLDQIRATWPLSKQPALTN